MKNRTLLLVVGTLLTLALVVVGCAHEQVKQSFATPPQWFDNPVKGCAVGSEKVRSMVGFARDAAVTNARRNLAADLTSHIQSMMKQYKSEGEADAKDFSEELSSEVTRELVDKTLVGTRAVKTEMRGNQYYAMVCLDPETFGDIFDRMNKLSGQERRALKARAKAEFKDMDAQLKKLRERDK